MGESLTDKLSELPAARREHILAEADHLDTESLSLQELRKTKRLTQAQLAEVLNIRQATIARMEQRSDLMLSTLRGYLEAMGGKLSLIVDFPDRAPVLLEGLGNTDERLRRRKGSRASKRDG